MSLKPPDQDGDDDLDLTIRFSASIPDLLLTIPSSTQANTTTLKQRIRERLPSEYSNRRLRLIYAGKALIDDIPLNSSLKRQVSKSPSRVTTPGPYDDDDEFHNHNSSSKSKGKAVIRDPPARFRIYIHCSIGDLILTQDEMIAEATLGLPTRDRTEEGERSNDGNDLILNIPPPKGFDRLLSAGFTPSEIQSLRLQFLAIQSHTHTPDSLPSPNTLRNMEDQWLDNSNTGGDNTDIDGNRRFPDHHGDYGQVGALDDLIWGTTVGFFWPIGCMMWALREEGIWSQRRKMSVVVGFAMNIGLGLLKFTR